MRIHPPNASRRPLVARRATVGAVLTFTLSITVGFTTLLSAGVTSSGCTRGKPAVSYTGREKPPIATVEQIRSFAGTTPPDGHEVLGVVTARCETVNNSAGVLAGRCSHPNMREAAAERAVAVGGTGLLEVECRTEQTGREFTRQDAGVSKVDTRQRIVCRATVVRGSVALDPPPTDTENDAGVMPNADAGQQLDLDGVAVMVSVTRNPGAPSFPPRPVAGVGELDDVSTDLMKLADMQARCVKGCARRKAIHALRLQAAALGALVIAGVKCELEGDRWRCSASAMQAQAAAPSR